MSGCSKRPREREGGFPDPGRRRGRRTTTTMRRQAASCLHSFSGRHARCFPLGQRRLGGSSLCASAIGN
eukprot:5596178-Pyramimonas_sp.AAC.1